MWKKIQKVGDPHLGREFKHNVPLHRRGERENLLFKQFSEEMQPQAGVDLVLVMGDLFDKPQVSYETVWHAHGIVANAAANHPNVEFWFLQGNHDESRNLDEITAWNLFCLLVCHRTNVRCICDALVVPPYVFLPWSPRYSAIQMLQHAVASHQEDFIRGRVTHAFGHWDLDPRSAEWNLIPTQHLASAGIHLADTGHVHKPDSFVRDGVSVRQVGSMQALAHGEDGGQGPIRYLTYTLDELDHAGIDLRNTCIRVRLAPGEPVPEAQDCLNWQVERIVEGEDGDAFGVELTLDGFSLAGAYDETMSEADIIPEVREKIDAKWKTIFAEPSSDTSSISPASA